MRDYYLVSYDISNPKRLQKIHKLMRGYGDSFQYSVFLCQLSTKEYVIMKNNLYEKIKPSEDQIVIIRLGTVDKQNITSPDRWTVIGRKLNLSDNNIMIF